MNMLDPTFSSHVVTKNFAGVPPPSPPPLSRGVAHVGDGSVGWFVVDMLRLHVKGVNLTLSYVTGRDRVIMGS